MSAKLPRELLQLLIGHPSVAADILEAGECVFAADNKGFDPSFEAFGMDMEEESLQYRRR